MSEKIVASTQDHLDIEDIKEGLLILKNGGACAVLETSSVNFDLLSEREQDATISAYSALLNSLSFPMQIVIRSKKMDITTYVETIKAQESKHSDPKTKTGLTKYRKFVEELVVKNDVLDKKFYVVVPHLSVSLKPATDPFFWLKSLLGLHTKKVKRLDTKNIAKRALVSIEPKVEHLIKEFSRINIKARRLSSEELTELFYDIYNPESARLQKVKGSIDQYTTPLVEPKVT